MDCDALALAVIPPFLALLVEALNPVNERWIRKSAKDDLTEQLNSSEWFFDTIHRATTLATAAAKVSGLAPTLVAVVTSGFAVIHEMPKPFWPAILYVIAISLGVLSLIWLLSGATFYQIGSVKIAVSFNPEPKLIERGPTGAGRTRQQLVSAAIYLANILLIAASFLVYFYLKLSGTN